MHVTEYEFFKALKALPFIQEIWLFGSRARNDHQDRADIDLAIVCPTATFDEWLRIDAILDHRDTLLKVDCVRLDDLDSESPLKKAILNQGIKLYPIDFKSWVRK